MSLAAVSCKMIVFTLGAQISPYLAKSSCCLLLLVSTLLAPVAVSGHVANSSSTQAASDPDLVLVNKCCEKFEIHVNNTCQQVNQTDYFEPMFTSYSGDQNRPVAHFKFVIGLPNCGNKQMWPVLDYAGSYDKLVLLDDGKLRHYTNTEDEAAEERGIKADYDEDLAEAHKPRYYDYEQGEYCLDKAISPEHKQSLFAHICLARKENNWNDSNFLLRKILNPIFHVVSMIILLIIAIIYFILPTLRDLVGNMVTTISMCLMVSQAADLVCIFTDFTSHVSFIVADIILCFSLLAAFFWLNSFGYYIWKTFRSRNVFLRVTDGRKYCYYSVYAWGCTATMAAMAVFAHFFLDADPYKKENMRGEQQTIGWLGICIFFAPIACTIIVNIFFYATTRSLINRRIVYGRIAHKLKANFIMFTLMLLVMSFAWLFLTMSWLALDGLLYAHIIVNAFQAPFLLYICVLRQRHVTFLLKKSCCYNEPPSANDWGDEMHNMNGSEY